MGIEKAIEVLNNIVQKRREKCLNGVSPEANMRLKISDMRLILEALKENEVKGINPEDICNAVIQHTIQGDITCRNPKPCSFHDVPVSSQTAKDDSSYELWKAIKEYVMKKGGQ